MYIVQLYTNKNVVNPRFVILLRLFKWKINWKKDPINQTQIDDLFVTICLPLRSLIKFMIFKKMKIIVNYWNINLFNDVALSAETAMGVSIDAMSKPNSPYVQAVKE